MPDIKFGCRATVIGSMPHKDPAEACAVVSRYLKDFPAWPQLPNRSIFENMYIQYSKDFPGVVWKTNSIYIDRRKEDVTESIGDLYTAYEKHDVDKYPISHHYAEGLHAFLASKKLSSLAVKGQITGPITWGLTITDEEGRAIIYDDLFQEMVAMFLGLKAGWQEKALSQISKNTIIFVDEPYMSAFGSVAVPFDKDRVVKLLNEIFRHIRGIKGIHCCGNTDWPVLLQTNTQILSFDAYNYAQSLSLYPAEVKEFLEKKRGAIAWGIVPNEAEPLAKETVASLKDRLEEAMAPFTRNGIPFRQLLEQGLLTPSCGLASLTEDAAIRALELLAELSTTVRQRYL